MHAELKLRDDDEDDGIKGDPIWVELQMGAQKVQTKVRGSHSAVFNEAFRFYLDGVELASAFVNVRIYSTRTFGGKQLVGKSKIPLQPLVPNTLAPLTLTPEENQHGMLVCQCKLTPAKRHEMARPLGPYRKPILKCLPALGLRQRHSTDDVRAQQRLIDLKGVLCIETNVFQDYPCWYSGLDAMGRVELDGLVDMGDRLADDIFGCLKAFGTLHTAMHRPMDMLSLECAQHSAYQQEMGYVCAGRYETLLKAQQFVAHGGANCILVVSGKAGSGKSNVMACLDKMFTMGHRVQANPHSTVGQPKRLQLDHILSNINVLRGSSWQRPEVVSMYMGASNGNTTPRYLLYLLMNHLAHCLVGSRVQVQKSEHRAKVERADVSQLFPIAHEYNKLRLQFLTLCQNIDNFVPHKRILILIDQIECIDAMRFDWLPLTLPKSLRLVISCGKANVIKKMATSSKSLKLDLLQLQPLPTLARKEMVVHLLRKRGRALNMQQMDALVLHEGANMPDYLHMAVQVLGAFQHHMQWIMPVIKHMEETSSAVAAQVLERMELYCGRKIVRECLSLLFISIYGLNEMEVRMMLGVDAVHDSILHHLPEEHEGTPAEYPQTSRDERHLKLSHPGALMPLGLWAPLCNMLKPFLSPSHPFQASKLQFLHKSFAATVAERYGLESEHARIELHRRIGGYYRARADPELQLSWRSSDFRAAQSLVYHMIGAHDWDKLSHMLADLGFLEFCVSLGQVHGLCSDLKHAISGLDCVGRREGADMSHLPDLMSLSSFVTANAHTLLDHPTLLLQKMANERPNSAVARMAMRRIQGGWEGRNWLKRLRQQVDRSANTRSMDDRSPNRRTIRGHKGWIRALAVTCDCRYIVSGADDKTARFWDCDSGALMHVLTGHRQAITGVDVSGCGLYLVTSSMDATVNLWDVRSGIQLANLFVGSAATCCKLSHDAGLILAGTLNSTLHIFDMRTLQELHVMRSQRLGIRACIFSKDSTKVLSAGSDGQVMVWDLNLFTFGKKNIDAPTATLKGHSNGVRALAWNPRNANQAVSGSDDCSIVVWKVEEQEIARKLLGHSAAVLSLSFTPSGAYLLSCSHDSSVIVWDPNMDHPLFRFWGHAGPVYSVVVSVDEYTALSAGADSTIRSWDLRGLLREDPDEPHLVSHQSTASLKDQLPPSRVQEAMQYGDIYSLAFSPGGDVVVAGSQDSSYALRSIHDGRIIGEPVRGHAGAVYSCQWHPDGQRILTGSQDTILKMWEVASGRLQRAFKGHSGPILGCSFFPDGHKMVSVSADHYIRIWDLETGQMLHNMPPHLAHLSPVRCCAISPENNVFCTGGDDHFVRVWVSPSSSLGPQPCCGGCLVVTALSACNNQGPPQCSKGLLRLHQRAPRVCTCVPVICVSLCVLRVCVCVCVWVVTGMSVHRDCAFEKVLFGLGKCVPRHDKCVCVLTGQELCVCVS